MSDILAFEIPHGANAFFEAALHGEFLSALCPAARKHATAGWRALPCQKPVGSAAFFIFLVIRKRHAYDFITLATLLQVFQKWSKMSYTHEIPRTHRGDTLTRDVVLINN